MKRFIKSEGDELISSVSFNSKAKVAGLQQTLGQISSETDYAYPATHAVGPVRASGIVVVLEKPHTVCEAALRYGITARTLLRANPELASNTVLHPGLELCIPHAPPAPCIGGYYVILRKGESLESTAAEHGISLDALHLTNPALVDPARVAAGQVVCVPKEGSLCYHFDHPSFGFLPFE